MHLCNINGHIIRSVHTTLFKRDLLLPTLFVSGHWLTIAKYE